MHSARVPRDDGPAAVLEPRSRRPISSPTRLSQENAAQAIRVRAATDSNNLTVADLHGEILIEHTRPQPGVTYVGNRRPTTQTPRQR